MQCAGDTALTLAASGGHVEAVNALLENGANIEARSEVMLLTCSGVFEVVVRTLEGNSWEGNCFHFTRGAEGSQQSP